MVMWSICRVKKVDVSSTFIENIFWSGLTLVSSNDIITIKIDKKNNKNLLKTTNGHKGNELRLSDEKNKFSFIYLLLCLVKKNPTNHG